MTNNFTWKIKYMVIYYIIAPWVLSLAYISFILKIDQLAILSVIITIIAQSMFTYFYFKSVVKRTGDPFKVFRNIIDYDYEDIDKAFLGTSEIKDKHIYPKNSGTTTSKNIKKNHHKKLT